MFGFVFGTACLVGLFWVLKRGHCHAGYGDGFWGSRRRHGGFGRRNRSFFGGGWFVEELIDGLDATPSQQKAIREALSELRSALGRFKDALLDTRRDMAGSVRAEAFDEVRMGETFARHDDAIGELRKAIVGALAQMHAVLDERQRARLADLLESGPRRWGHSDNFI